MLYSLSTSCSIFCCMNADITCSFPCCRHDFMLTLFLWKTKLWCYIVPKSWQYTVCWLLPWRADNAGCWVLPWNILPLPYCRYANLMRADSILSVEYCREELTILSVLVLPLNILHLQYCRYANWMHFKIFLCASIFGNIGMYIKST